MVHLFLWDCLSRGGLLKIQVLVGRLEIPELGLVLTPLTQGLVMAILPEDAVGVVKAGTFSAFSREITAGVLIGADLFS